MNDMHPLLLIVFFIISTLAGYVIIKNVPSLLHTPLMSGMNALSGITVTGALTATAAALYTGNQAFGYVAIFLGMLNIAGGFCITHKMLKMFKNKDGDSK